MRSPAIAAALALLITGCRVFDESLLDAGEDEDAGPADAGADAPHDAGPDDAGRDAGPSCPLTRPPPRPEVIDAPSVDEVWYALEGIDLDQPGTEWATIGYDLDGLCSEAPDPVVECLPPSSSSVPETDGEGGIDNVLGHQIMPLLLVARPDLASNSVRDQHHGVSAFILRVRRWNGTPTDPLVDVTLAIAEFGTPELPDGGVPMPELPDAAFVYGDGGTLPPPRWDGTDYWWVRADNFLSGNPERPRIRDDNAYITDGVIVMRLPDNQPLVLTGGVRSIIFRLTDAVLTARLSEDFTAVEEAVVAGRWPISDMLESVAFSGICIGSGDYESFARLLDLAADVRAAPGTGGPGATCDAVSVGVRLFGTRAHFGGVSDILGIPDACDPSAMDGGVGDGG